MEGSCIGEGGIWAFFGFRKKRRRRPRRPKKKRGRAGGRGEIEEMKGGLSLSAHKEDNG